MSKRRRQETRDKDEPKIKKRKMELKKARTDHEATIREHMLENKRLGQRGQVRCGRLPYRFGKGDKTWPKTEGFKNINVCSGSKRFRGLSPMCLGPYRDLKVVANTNGDIETLTGQNLENVWQASKVWEGDIDIFGRILPVWFRDRDTYWSDTRAHRHIKGKKGKKVLFSLWVNQETGRFIRLSYLDARRAIYCPLYEQLVKSTEAYKALEKALDNGFNVQILGDDGYDVEGLDLEDCLNDKKRPFGHELCLVALLRHETLW